MTYNSDESGRMEVYLTRFPSGAGKWQVSADGGQWPHWNGRGDRLYFARGNDILEVEVRTEASAAGVIPDLGTPTRLFTRVALGPSTADTYAGFDVTRDGARFLTLRPAAPGTSDAGIVIVESWQKEFGRQ